MDWEIFNRPNKGSLNGFSHFAIRAEYGGKVLDARVLQGDMLPPYEGELGGGPVSGHRPKRENMAAAPHFRQVVFRGEFPIAERDFHGARFPGRVSMTAFNPFIPLIDKNSGIPAAFFEITVRNTARHAMTYTVIGALTNPLAPSKIHRVTVVGVLRGRQHHTLDMERFGINSWLTGHYLVALKAAAEMAESLGEDDFAEDLRALFTRWSGYQILPEQGYDHVVVRPRAEIGDDLLPLPHLVGSHLKRWLLGTHQAAVRPSHLDYYLDEFTFRFNRRTSRSRGLLFYRLLQQAVAVPAEPADRIRGGGPVTSETQDVGGN